MEALWAGCDQRRLPVGGDLEEAEGFAYAQMHGEALLSEETAHANAGRARACSLGPGSRAGWETILARSSGLRPQRPHPCPRLLHGYCKAFAGS